MFSEEEIEALVLGSRWVADRTDSKLKNAAHNALAKISAVLPADLRAQLESSGLLIGPGQVIPAGDIEWTLLVMLWAFHSHSIALLLKTFTNKRKY